MGHQPTRGRLEGHRGQCAGEIGLMKSGGTQAGRLAVGGQPHQGQLVRRGQHDQRVGVRVPMRGELWMGEGEIEGGVHRLARLGSRRQIGTGDQIEGGGTALPEWHRNQATRPAQGVSSSKGTGSHRVNAIDKEVAKMPWVRSHYRRPAGYGYGGPYSTGMIVLIVLGVLLLIYLVTR
jgi:hypothetical protein